MPHLKIYMKNKNTIVFDGKTEDIEHEYYPYKENRVGTMVIGAEHIAISKDAKKAITKLITEGKKTGDDISCVDLYEAHPKEEKPYIVFSYIDRNYAEWNVDEILKDEDFWIGCGEGVPDVTLLEKIPTLTNE
ncbi:MAG: hypothetical protein U0L73_12500 [Ruminococcus bromii]|nr:hypothetical protein [Ruminococcus bromii]